MHVAAPAPLAPPATVAPAVAVQHNIADLLHCVAFDVSAARQRMRIVELDRTSARAMGAVARTLEGVGRIEGECAEIRRAAGGIVWEIAL